VKWHRGAAEAIQVRYVVGNAGTADLLNCSIGEGNPGFPGTVSVGRCRGRAWRTWTAAMRRPRASTGVVVVTSGVNSAACSATLSAAEPDKATVTCDCTPTPGEVQATAFDEANFQCQTPGLTVTKDLRPAGHQRQQRGHDHGDEHGVRRRLRL